MRQSLDEKDWSQIDDLLAERTDGLPAPRSDDSVVLLLAALDQLRSLVHGQITGTGWVTNQLLDIWAVARDIDAEVARPAELLLSSLVGRDLASAAEINATCDLIRSAALALSLDQRHCAA